jgi:hypothetical protein
MKRQVLRIVIALGVALSAASPALGQTYTYLFNGSANLTAAGDEASASGRAKLSGQYSYDYWLGADFSGDVSVSCSGLAPNATYLIAMSGSGIGEIASPDGIADGRGNLTITSSWWWWGGVYDSPDTLEVYRVEPTGNVLVLSGTISFKYKFVRFH